MSASDDEHEAGRYEGNIKEVEPGKRKASEASIIDDDDEEDSNDVGSTPYKKSRQGGSQKRSAIWNYIILEGENVVCKLCKDKGVKVKYKYVNYSTTNISGHLLSPLHHNECKELRSESAVASAKLQASIPSMIVKMRQAPLPEKEQLEIRQLLNLFIIGAQLPMHILEHPGFKTFIHHLNPNFHMHSRRTFKESDLPALVLSLKSLMRENMMSSKGVSITLDAWTSNGVPFLAITAHYIDRDYCLKSNVIAFIHAPQAHSAANIDVIVSEVLNEYFPDDSWITEQKIYCATTDGANNMTCFGKNPFRKGFSWVRCFAHLLNLTVQESLAELAVEDALKKLRQLRDKFKYEKESTSQFLRAQNDMRRQQNLKELQAPMMLKRDVTTRWNSVLFMFLRALKLKDAIQLALFNMKQLDLDLSPTEWSMIEALVLLLEPFHIATEEISSQSQVTISKPVMILQARLNALKPCSSDSDLVKGYKQVFRTNLANRKAAYEKESFVTQLASLLDPRFKMYDWVSTTKAKKTLETLLSSIPISTQVSDGAASSLSTAAVSEKAKRQLALYGQLPQEDVSAPDELTIYFMEPSLKVDENPLIWWRAHAKKLPRLHALAMRTLSAQASELPSERCFSDAGNIYTNKRQSMHPTTLMNLLLVFVNHPQLVADRCPKLDELDDSDDEDALA